MAVPKLLFVDDEIGTRRLVEQYLKLSPQEKYDITFAHTGTEAIKILQESPESFDLLITDIKMPEVDGWELINFSQSNYNLKSIIISAFGTVDNLQRAFEEQVVDFFIKPFKFNKLFQSIKRTIDLNTSSCRTIEKVKLGKEFEKKITYNTIARLARELQPSQQVKLISDLLKNFDLDQLESFQIEIPALKENLLERQEERERAKKKDAERIAKGYTPLTLVADSWIEERWQTEMLASGVEKRYLFYILRWREEGRLKSRTLKRSDLCDPEIRVIVEKKLGKPIDPYYD